MKTILLLTVLSFALTIKAQDAQFSQFYASPVYINPAFAGAGLCGGRVVANYRNQWPSLPGTFRTTAVSYDQSAPGIGGGFGLQAFNDIAGDGLLTTTSFSGIYAYHGKFSKKVFYSASIQGSYTQRTIDFDKLRFSDQIVAKKGFVNPTSEVLVNEKVDFSNFSTGFLVFTEKFYAGFAVHNLTEPNQSFFGNNDPGTTLPRKYTLHAGLNIPVVKSKSHPEKAVSFSPNILIMKQQHFTQVNAGFYLNKGPLVTGVWFRQTAPNSDALILLLGVRSGDFRFGYSYDITVSKARAAAMGSHEVSAAYEFCIRRKGPRPPGMDICPKF